MNKEWIKNILNGSKKLLKLTQIKPVNVGNFPEVSVKHLFEEFSSRPEIAVYMPPRDIQEDEAVRQEVFLHHCQHFFP